MTEAQALAKLYGASCWAALSGWQRRPGLKQCGVLGLKGVMRLSGDFDEEALAFAFGHIQPRQARFVGGFWAGLGHRPVLCDCKISKPAWIGAVEARLNLLDTPSGTRRIIYKAILPHSRFPSPSASGLWLSSFTLHTLCTSLIFVTPGQPWRVSLRAVLPPFQLVVHFYLCSG